jgi:HAD superfamily hydrolase (TIGR01509 family)
MMLPEVVVFDLGKVLLDFDYTRAAQGIASKGTVTAQEVKDLINQTPLLLRYETGLMSKVEFYEAIRSATGFTGDVEEFGRIFGDIFEPMPEMIELHGALRKKGIPTFIFSNTSELAVAHIRKAFPFFNEFNGYILSYEHGAMKPQTKLYEVVEQKTGHRREKIIYIDDRPENIEAGAARDWQVILQETPAKSRAALRKAGLLNQA